MLRCHRANSSKVACIPIRSRCVTANQTCTRNRTCPSLTLANSKWVIVLGDGALAVLRLYVLHALLLSISKHAGAGWSVTNLTDRTLAYRFRSPGQVRDDPLVPPYFKRAEDAMQFRRTLDPLQFQASEVREAYAIAVEMPDVLAQQPCYCRRPVLRSLLHCFANLEATNCEICVKEAQLVGQLHRQGRSASEIRAVVVGQYGVLSARPTR
jgi:hypothetical protein